MFSPAYTPTMQRFHVAEDAVAGEQALVASGQQTPQPIPVGSEDAVKQWMFQYFTLNHLLPPLVGC